MPNTNNGTLNVIDIELVNLLEKEQLIDLLQHKTNLLIAARKSVVVDHRYINNLQQEIQIIQTQLLVRFK